MPESNDQREEDKQRDEDSLREKLKETLCCYTFDTLTYIDIVRRFSETASKWILAREREIILMGDIKERLDRIDVKVSHITQSKKKYQAFREYVKGKFTQMNGDRKRAELEKELSEVLNDTLKGLEELDCFLDAVEKLAVTSLHVFTENQVLHLPKGISLEYVQAVIKEARHICPLLLEFKRDAKVFFLPKLQNLEVLSYQLDRYIQTTKTICEKLEKSYINGHDKEITPEAVVNLSIWLSGDKVDKMLEHIIQLDQIRMDPDFRMVFLFQKVSCSHFIHEFSERQPMMLQFLQDLEETAVKLDSMNKGAKISSVASSSVGVIGGIISIVGLALIPVTAGLSLSLSMAGMTLGILSGVNSVVTTLTEVGVNHNKTKQANEVFQSFIRHFQSLQCCLKEVMSQIVTKIETDAIKETVDVIKAGCSLCGVGNKINSLAESVAAFKVLKSEVLNSSTGKVAVQKCKAVQNVSRIASDFPDVGQAVAKGPLALTGTARAALIGANAVFLGLDVIFICKNGYSLAKGSETAVSKLIRARAALWRSEMNSWKKIHDSLCKGCKTSEEKKAVLETAFYTRHKGCKTSEEKKAVLETAFYTRHIQLDLVVFVCFSCVCLLAMYLCIL